MFKNESGSEGDPDQDILDIQMEVGQTEKIHICSKKEVRIKENGWRLSPEETMRFRLLKFGGEVVHRIRLGLSLGYLENIPLRFAIVQKPCFCCISKF